MNLENVKQDLNKNRSNKYFFSDSIVVNEKEIDSYTISKVNLSLVKGTFKEEFKSKKLYDIAKTELYKNNTIRKYKNKASFETFLNQRIQGLPSLIFLNDRYYIWQDGNHRIVLAKLVGINEAEAIINFVSPSEEKRLSSFIN